MVPTTIDSKGPFWPRLLLVLLVIGGCLACSKNAADNDDAFTSFQPTIDQLPTPPVSNAVAREGVIDPQDVLFECSPWSYGTDNGHIVGKWNGIRYDWSDEGVPTSWVIGVQTVSYSGTPSDARQNAAQAAEDCVLESSADDSTLGTERIQLPGLPKGTQALRIQGEVGEARTRTLDAYVATVAERTPDDGRPRADRIGERSRVVGVYWIGWDTDVPPDEFAGFVNFISFAASAGTQPSNPPESSSTAASSSSARLLTSETGGAA